MIVKNINNCKKRKFRSYFHERLTNEKPNKINYTNKYLGNLLYGSSKIPIYNENNIIKEIIE